MRYFVLVLALLAAGCATGSHGSYRDNTSYNNPYLATPIDNDIYD